MKYRRCGKSGLKLPAISLGFWQNFGGFDSYENGRAIMRKSFDLGITHFDLANNYGPPPGSAEENFGKILKSDFSSLRDELIISTKAGYTMWPGPYGDWGSKKYLVASLDQSLKRMGLDYVDIFYHHRPDPETPLEESMDALASIVRQGKALYVGLSNYSPEDTKKASGILKSMGIKCLIHQPKYSMFVRTPEEGLHAVLEEEGIGSITFSPLAQGLLTSKYFNGIPEGSRAAIKGKSLNPEAVTPEKVEMAKKLNVIAAERGQSLAQMAVAWNLRKPVTTSVLVGASKVSQIEENVKALDNISFTEDELKRIDQILG
jgi:L-glyceraldehyde 3-phosphate reductase